MKYLLGDHVKMREVRIVKKIFKRYISFRFNQMRKDEKYWIYRSREEKRSILNYLLS